MYRRMTLLATSAALLLTACGGVDTSAERGPTGAPAERGAQGPGVPIPGPDASTGRSGEGAPSPPAPPPAATPEPSSGAPPAASPSKVVLNVRWFGQETYYWCGPASTRMALGTRLPDPPSQTALAAMMGTTENGTDHVGLVAGVLNRLLAPSAAATYRARPVDDPPTPAQQDLLKRDVLTRIGAGFPIVANVVSGWRPPGYPGGTIYHYVTVVGFDDAGDKVQIADPAAEGKGGGAAWNGVPRTYWISIADLGVWIGGKGYAG